MHSRTFFIKSDLSAFVFYSIASIALWSSWNNQESQDVRLFRLDCNIDFEFSRVKFLVLTTLFTNWKTRIAVLFLKMLKTGGNAFQMHLHILSSQISVLIALWIFFPFQQSIENPHLLPGFSLGAISLSHFTFCLSLACTEIVHAWLKSFYHYTTCQVKGSRCASN